MKHPDRRLLDKARDVAKTLIERNYVEELPLFDTFWAVFESRVQALAKLPPNKRDLRKLLATRTVPGLGFGEEMARDYRTLRVCGAAFTILLDVGSAQRDVPLSELVPLAVGLHGKRTGLSARLISQLEELVHLAAAELGYSLVETRSGAAEVAATVKGEAAPVQAGGDTHAAAEAEAARKPRDNGVSRTGARRAKAGGERSHEMRATGTELERTKRKIEKLQKKKREDDFGEIIGKSWAVRKLVEQIQRVKDSDATVLITGETGVGKDLIARVIHDHGNRHDGLFVTANLAGFPDTALESELFGHEKGAFTGAVERKEGKFKLADRGTIFLDEVGDLNETCQMRLLRVLEHGEFERLGGTVTLRVDVRVIAATNRDLRRGVKERTFRQDLYYRVNKFHIEIPPLRERKEDIPALVDHFCEQLGKPRMQFASAVMDRLLTHEWPGNIRELKDCVERAIPGAKANVVGAADIDTADLEMEPELLRREDSEEQLMLRALKGSRRSEEARRKLKMPKSTFYDKLKKYGIRPKDFLRRGE